MEEIQKVLLSAIWRMLSDPNYEQSLAFYRLWVDIGQTYFQISSDQMIGAIWNNRAVRPIVSISTHCGSSHPTRGAYNLDLNTLIRPNAHLAHRFASDAESDHTIAPHNARLQSRPYTRALRGFFDDNSMIVRYKEIYAAGGVWSYSTDVLDCFCVNTNLVARWANLGYVDEPAIRNHILQSLISYPTLYDHQADALVILFKLAGATFEAYADPSVVDRCFELLKDYSKLLNDINDRDSTERNLTERNLIQVSALSVNGVTLKPRQNHRKYLSYGSVAGRVSLPHQYSRPVNRSRLARTRKTPPQLPSPHTWDFPTEISNLRFLSPLHSNWSPPQRQTRFLHLPSPNLRPSASPLCPTS